MEKRKPVEWKLDRIECFSTHCHPFNCKLTRLSRTVQNINVNCSLLASYDKVYVHFKMFYRYNRYQPFLLDVNVDLCDALMGNKTKFQPFMEFATPLIRKHTNLNRSCPIDGVVEIRNLQYNDDLVKGTLLPGGQYRVDTRVYDPRTNETMFLEQSYLTHSSTFSVKDLAMG